MGDCVCHEENGKGELLRRGEVSYRSGIRGRERKRGRDTESETVFEAKWNNFKAQAERSNGLQEM